MPRLKTILRECLLLSGVELNTTRHSEKLLSALGAFLGIAGVYGASLLYLDQVAALLMTASMGATAVLVFAVPHGALSQPWPVAAGHLVSAAIGVSCQQWLPGGVLSSAAAVGLAVGAMHYLRCIHPPGGATALTAVIGGEAVWSTGYGFVLFPVLVNVLSILGVGIVFNSPFRWRRYPARLAYWPRPKAKTQGAAALQLTQEDFAAAMQELNSLVDVTADDLARLFELAVAHAESEEEHPAEIVPGRFYSNGQLGQRWRVRQIVDASEVGRQGSKVIYKVVAGDPSRETGICSAEEFRQWARFEVRLKGEHWLRINGGIQNAVPKHEVAPRRAGRRG